MAVTGHALNQLLQQMDRTFSNVTGQSVSFIDQEGHYQGPLRLDVFTGFCRRVISSEKGAQHCLACNHSFGLDAEQRCTVSQCHMGISVISVPVPLPEARGLSLTYGQFLTRDTEGGVLQHTAPALSGAGAGLRRNGGTGGDAAGALCGRAGCQDADAAGLCRVCGHLRGGAGDPAGPARQVEKAGAGAACTPVN